MQLLMFNLAVDAEHVTLAFGLGWIERLAGAFERIDIVTMRKGKYRLPANVHVVSAGLEHGYPLWWRIIRFYALTIRILLTRRPAIAFAHMIPEFALLFWPLSVLWRIPLILWYAHGATPRNLRLAHRLVDHVVSSTPEGFRLPSGIVTFIGQGIEPKRFCYRVRTKSDTLRLISVGRLAPSKGQETIIKALALFGRTHAIPWHITFVGGPTNEQEQVHGQHLLDLANELLPAGSFTFTGRLDADEVAAWLAQSDLSLNLSTTGSLDKTILESMAGGCPVFSSNDAFRTIARAEGFADCVVEETAESLNEGLNRFVAMAPEAKQELARRQSAVALRDHSIDGLIERLVRLLQSFALARN